MCLIGEGTGIRLDTSWVAFWVIHCEVRRAETGRGSRTAKELQLDCWEGEIRIKDDSMPQTKSTSVEKAAGFDSV